MGVREARKEARRAAIEQAGLRGFLARGYDLCSVEQIAAEVGIARGTFYLYFDDKHALFEELVDAALEEMRPQSHAERTGRRGEESMRHDLERMLEVAQRRRNLIRAVFDRGESSGLAERIQDRIASAFEERYTRVFRERGIALHPRASAQARAALLVRVIAWWAEDPTRAEREEIIDVLMELAPGRVRKSEEEAQ